MVVHTTEKPKGPVNLRPAGATQNLPKASIQTNFEVQQKNLCIVLTLTVGAS